MLIRSSFISAVPRTIQTGTSASGPRTTWLRVQGPALGNPSGWWRQQRGNWDHDMGRFLGCLPCPALHPVESHRAGYCSFSPPTTGDSPGCLVPSWEGEEEPLRSSL